MLVTEVFDNARAVEPSALEHRVAVVIDVLRASTTIIAALAAGARAVIPVASVEAARQRAAGSDVLLGGERNGVAPAGFALGNSPLEYTPEAVAGKTVVLTTTNGTLAIERCRAAERIVIAAFTNLAAVRRWLEAYGRPAALVCAGGPSGPSEEDLLCAGVLAHEVGGKGPGLVEARALVANEPDVERALRDCRHGRFLAEIGLGEDVSYCARRDTTSIVPVLEPDGRLIAEGDASCAT